MPQIKKNRLVNRASGLYAGGSHKTQGEEKSLEIKIDFIATDLRSLAVPIDSLIPDPENAREHPERNLDVIRESLCRYGQRTPLVVNKRNNHIEKGNGTYATAKALGWTVIAAIFEDDAPHIAAGYGLIDNRSAELAKWNFEVVARIDALLQAENQSAPGWTLDELEILRQADWTPPPIEDENQEASGVAKKELTVTFSEDQYVTISAVLETLLLETDGSKKAPDKAELLTEVCDQWLQQRLIGGEDGTDQESQ